MNKADLIEAVAREANFTHVDTKRAIDATISVIQKALKRGDTVGLVGFGSFTVRKRAARTARNPRTGELIPIAARRVVTFHPSQKLKEMLKGDDA